ncbi:YjfB family protein [Alkalihalobacillus trypoxylicola]|uniref:Motility protein n=1 Tax=Alkalihalobacillus trypoxylicola TaxID=519424 RepID=A0A162ETW8_9BACI|nr:YjfB family protein [Alkalihalobacillus trypoxylicola]KYG33716.1 hypothetical protein AZF04_15950 [Alkalihalobacillus trypoxylicola]GAF65675.1 hypothetical protein BTS2_2573 [Bacillus sp. TS-2]
MDIAMLSIALNQNQVQSQASLSLMKKTLGEVEQQGEAIKKLMSTADVRMIQSIAEPHLGQSIDIRL